MKKDKITTIPIATLKKRQLWPLDKKIKYSLSLIQEWYESFDGGVYVAFSGGKDSTVLLHLVRRLYPDVPGVFSNTGLEFPEVVSFVKTIENIIWVKPDMHFSKVIQKYGYPIISKKVAQIIYELANTKSESLRKLRLTGIRTNGEYSPLSKLSNKWKFLMDAPFKIGPQCCHVLKKKPMHSYEKKTNHVPYIGTMASEGIARQMDYSRYGCNAYDLKDVKSRPLSIWTESDVWKYLKKNQIPYSSIYEMGYYRTGCIFCGFGVHMEKGPNRFQLMKKTHPKLYRYCLDKLSLKEILDYINIPY